jgi:hypothetical protein
MQPAEADRRRDHEPAARPVAFLPRGAVGLLDVGEDAPDALQVARTDVGEGDQPRCPLCNSRAPRCSSSDAISRVTADGDSRSLRAAGAKPRNSATATKTRMASRRSISLLHILQ